MNDSSPQQHQPHAPLSRRAMLAALSSVPFAGMIGRSALAAPAEAPGAAPQGDFAEITPALQESVSKGLAYLAQQQQPDGSFGADRYGRHVGTSALAGLAFMSNGDVPGRGRYGTQVTRALDFVLDSVHENGLVAADTSHGPMYGHGFATLFLGEIYGMTHDRRTREALVKAVRLIVGSQNHEGGWRYQPVPREADISVTICQIMGLRAARNAGIRVPRETIDKAVEYTRRCQNADGGFRYMLSSGNSAFPRSAAGVATLYYAGIYSDDAIDRGLEYIMQHMPGEGRNTPHYFYGHYYAVQAMYMAGGRFWQQWFPAIREELLERQSADGSWDGQAGKSYGTSMALIILQMPNRYLPILQK
ncbi:MAG: prenyltransferase/squalene oxidase repeat-containing protein [Phycisphaeraceae bacterium]